LWCRNMPRLGASISCSCQYLMVVFEVKPLSQKVYAYWHRSWSISLRKSSMSNLSAILCAELWVWKLTPWSAKLQMFDDQSCHVWHLFRACLSVMCSRLDASNGICLVKNKNLKDCFLNYLDFFPRFFFSGDN